MHVPESICLCCSFPKIDAPRARYGVNIPHRMPQQVNATVSSDPTSASLASDLTDLEASREGLADARLEQSLLPVMPCSPSVAVLMCSNMGAWQASSTQGTQGGGEAMQVDTEGGEGQKVESEASANG